MFGLKKCLDKCSKAVKAARMSFPGKHLKRLVCAKKRVLKRPAPDAAPDAASAAPDAASAAPDAAPAASDAASVVALRRSERIKKLCQ